MNRPLNERPEELAGMVAGIWDDNHWILEQLVMENFLDPHTGEDLNEVLRKNTLRAAEYLNELIGLTGSPRQAIRMVHDALEKI